MSIVFLYINIKYVSVVNKLTCDLLSSFNGGQEKHVNLVYVFLTQDIKVGNEFSGIMRLFYVNTKVSFLFR